ncbi:MAG: YebC/PmpR family DNA-binding transcriptional regulator [bacterium]|nr:YebC/PmpR family DNA-binding transcriptional regulator [bacterium]
MSGHSKWATIKHKKAAIDAKRGKVFSRMSKEVTLAAKVGGGDLAMNPRLRTAVLAARAANMPADNIDRAIKKGTGELPGVVYEEIMYEAYGPAGVALMIRILTDNRNRIAGEVRTTLDRRNGSMAGAGAVAWQFNRKGFITIENAAASEETLFNIVTDAGAEDVQAGGEVYEITTPVEAFEAVKQALEQNKIATVSAEVTMLPASSVKITDEKEATAILRLIESIEEIDDVQNVYSNFDMDEELMRKVSEQM